MGKIGGVIEIAKGRHPVPVGVLGIGGDDGTDVRAGDRGTGNYAQRIAPA